MLKNANRLISKIVLTCLIFNTLPVHLPMHGAQPKGQELVALEQQINRDISNIKQATSRLKKAKYLVSGVIIVGGIIVTVVAIATVVIFFKKFKKKLENEHLEKLDEYKISHATAMKDLKKAASKKEKTLNSLVKAFKDKKPLFEVKNELEEKLEALTSFLTDPSQTKKALTKWITNKKKIFQNIKGVFELQAKRGKELADVDVWIKMRLAVLPFLPNVVKNRFINSLIVRLLDEDIGAAELIDDITKHTIKKMFKHEKRWKKIEGLKNAIKAVNYRLKPFDSGIEQAEKAVGEFTYDLSRIQPDLIRSLEKLKASDLPPIDTSEKVARNRGIIGAFIATLIGFVGIVGLPLVSFLAFHWASIAKANKGAERLAALKEKYPGILTARQGQVLAEFNKLSEDPQIQGIIKNALLRAALSKIVDETLKKYPSLITVLGGTKKASSAFKKYAKRKWKETTLQKALDVGVGKLIALKIKAQLGITRMRLRSLEKKLISKVKEAQLDVTQLKTALDRAAQSYIQQANAILKDLANRLIESIKAGKINLQTEPIIKLT